LQRTNRGTPHRSGKFFEALIHSDVEVLDRILSEDFIIIDVLKGAGTPKPEMVGAIGSGYVQFEKIEIRDNRVRLYDRTAVITGQTQMTVHACVLRNGWSMASGIGAGNFDSTVIVIRNG
jgi:hypothetical protein